MSNGKILLFSKIEQVVITEMEVIQYYALRFKKQKIAIKTISLLKREIFQEQLFTLSSYKYCDKRYDFFLY